MLRILAVITASFFLFAGVVLAQDDTTTAETPTVPALQAANIRLQNANATKMAELEAANARIAELVTSNGQLKNWLNVEKAAAAELERQLGVANARIAELEAANGRVAAAHTDATTRLQNAELAIAESQQLLEERAADTSTRIDQLTADADARLAERDARIAELEAQLEAEKTAVVTAAAAAATPVAVAPEANATAGMVCHSVAGWKTGAVPGIKGVEHRSSGWLLITAQNYLGTINGISKGSKICFSDEAIAAAGGG